MEKNWIKIYTTTNFYQAELMKQVLREHHIETVLMNKQDSSHRTFGDISIYIHKDDFSEAVEIIILNQINSA